MKRGRLILASALLGLAGTYAIAQGPQGQRGAPGMGMMAAMRDPLDQATMTAFLLPELQSELNLSAPQVAQLKQLKQELLTKGKEISSQISAKQKELDALLALTTTKASEVKKLLEEIANLRAQQEYAGYEASSKMKAVINEQQRTRLTALKPAEIYQAMMSHMTIGDMTQMMQLMGVDGMMPGRMMGMMGMMGSSPQK